MDAIETLMQEHRTIEKVIDALVAFTGEVGRKGATAREELAGPRQHRLEIHRGEHEADGLLDDAAVDVVLGRAEDAEAGHEGGLTKYGCKSQRDLGEKRNSTTKQLIITYR